MEVVAEWPGVANELTVAAGEAVAEEQELLVLESVKMLTPVLAPVAGTVSELAFEVEQNVDEGQLLLRIEPA